MSFIREIPPEEYDPQYLERLEQRIENAFNNLQIDRINLTKLYSSPEKITDGDLIYADGTEFNPGSGSGLYIRIGSSWNKL